MYWTFWCRKASICSVADPPDLSWPHSAIGLHFKVFHKTPEFAWHAPTNRWLKRDDLETKIEIYDDRVQGWFLEWETSSRRSTTPASSS